MNTFNTSDALLDADFIAEKKEWANTYGSDTLRLAIANNYSTNLRYFDERVKIEYPGFTFIRLNSVAKESNASEDIESSTGSDSPQESPYYPGSLLYEPIRVDSPSNFALKESLKYSGSYVASFILMPMRIDAQEEALVVDNYLGVCQIGKLVSEQKGDGDIFKSLLQNKKWKSLFCSSVLFSCSFGMFLSVISTELKILQVLSSSPCLIAELSDITKDLKETAKNIGLYF